MAVWYDMVCQVCGEKVPDTPMDTQCPQCGGQMVVDFSGYAPSGVMIHPHHKAENVGLRVRDPKFSMPK